MDIESTKKFHSTQQKNRFNLIGMFVGKLSNMVLFIRESIFVLLLIWFVISLPFFLGKSAVKDMAVLFIGFNANEKVKQAWNESHGFTGPYYVQYFNYIKLILRGELGESFIFRSKVLDVIRNHWKPTYILSGLAISIGLVVSPLIALLLNYTRKKSRKLFFIIKMIVSIGFIPLPIIAFFVRCLTLEYLGLDMNESHWQLIVGSIAIALLPIALLVYLIDYSIERELQSPRMMLVRAIGISTITYMSRFGWRQIVTKIIGTLRPIILYCLSFSFFVEYALRIRGLGFLIVEASLNADLPLLSGCMLLPLITLIVLSRFLNLITNILDPRLQWH